MAIKCSVLSDLNCIFKFKHNNVHFDMLSQFWICSAYMENVCCAWARLHVETVLVNTHRTRFTQVPVRCMYRHMCYRVIVSRYIP